MLDEVNNNEERQDGSLEPRTIAEAIPPNNVSPQQASTQPSASISLPPQPPQQSPTESEEVQISRAMLEVNRRSVRATTYGIVVAAIAALFFWLQFKTMTYQTQIFSAQAVASVANAISSDDLIKKQIAALQQQAQAAQDSVAEIRKQMRGSQAAIVTVGFPRNPDSIQALVIGIIAEFKNVGKVNALQFKSITSLQLIEIPDFTNIGSPQTLRVAKPQIPPYLPDYGNEVLVNAVFDESGVTEKDVDAIRTGKATYKITTIYSYDDGFGDTISQNRCYMFVHIIPPETGQQFWNEWMPCEFGRILYRKFRGR